MAPLTWRNVDAPNFSGPNEMWKLAATLMNQGFGSARRGINDFREITTDEQSAAMMQKVIGAGNDPAAIQAAVQGGNAAFLSPQALDFANKQPGVLLDRKATEANIERTGILNKATRQNMDVTAYDFGRKQTLDQRSDANYALIPEATAAMTNLRTQMAAGTLTGDAAATAQQDFIQKYGRALGITDASQVGSFLSNNQTAQTTQQGQDILRMQNFEQLGGLIRNKDARGIAANVLTQFPDLATAQRAIQGFGNIDPETKVAALKALEQLAPAAKPKTAADSLLESSPLFPGANTPRVTLPSDYQPVIMQNNGTRNRPLNNDLNAALNSTLPKLGLTAIVTSGGQVTADEAAQGLGNRTGSTRHDHGGAADVKFRTTDGRILSWKNPQDVPQLQAAVTELKKAGLTGFGAGSDYMGATTTHIGYGTPAVWGSKGGKPYQALLDAYNGATTTATTTSGPTVDRAAATAAAPQYQAAMDAISQNQPYNAPIDPNKIQIPNADGTVSTEKTFTTEIGGAWFNIPTVVNGKKLPEQEALDQFKKGTNPAVGVFQSQRQAETAAQARSDTISQMLSQSTNNTVAAQEQGQVNQNTQLTADASPSLAQTTQPAATPTTVTVAGNDRTKEIKVNDRWTIPAVDPNASQASQDWQNSQRRSAVNGVLESIKTDLATNQGGGPLASWAGGAWDYFMADPKTAKDNASARKGAGTALDWYQSDQAKTYFRDNPGALTEAAADPIGFQQRFKVSPQANQTATSATTNKTQTPTETPIQARTRALNNAETIQQMFSVVNNTGAMNQTNQQYQSITSAIQNRENANESATETAARLTNDKGPLKVYKHSEVTTAIQKIRDKLGVSPAIAGALLMETGNYSDGYLGGWLFGAGKGYDVQEMDKVKNLWDNYQRTANAAGGIAALAQSDMTKYQQQQVSTLQEQVTQAQATLQAAITNPATPPEKVALYQQQLAQLPNIVRERLNTIVTSGAMTNNLQTNTR